MYATVAMASGSQQLRFGILTDDGRVPAWAIRAIECLEGSGRARAALLIQAPRLAAPRRATGSLLPRVYRERWVQRRSRALQRVESEGRWPGVPKVVLAADGAARAAALSQVCHEQLDFILSSSDGVPAPDLLSLARLGLWGFAREQGVAACLEAVLRGHPKTRITLQRWTPEGTRVLCEGQFSTCKASWVNNIDRALFGAADFATRACALLGDSAEQGSVPMPAAARANGPRNRDFARLMLRNARRIAEKLWELGLHVEIWNVGSSTQSLEQVLRAAKVDAATVHWCNPHAPGHFIADPFVYSEGGQSHLLVEDYDQVKGRICTVLPSNGVPELKLGVDLELPFHMSYPCIFEDGGEIYCVPEVYQSRAANLYRRRDGRWELVRTLIESQPIVDPTLFKHDGRYWLLFTLQDDGAWGNQKLYAYHAPALDAPWVAHPLNPVKCDIGSTRPAGNVFELDGKLYRPSQDCSVTYGGAVVVNEIVQLTPTQFEEREATRIEPIPGSPYTAGFHTLNAMGSGVVFDSKKFAFDWLAWRKNRGRFHEVFQ